MSSLIDAFELPFDLGVVELELLLVLEFEFLVNDLLYLPSDALNLVNELLLFVCQVVALLDLLQVEQLVFVILVFFTTQCTLS